MENTLQYEVINLSQDKSHGVYDTLHEAHGAVRYDRLKAYEIWAVRDGDVVSRIEHCDPYEGDDDRAKQGLGLPNASEGR